MCMCIFLLWWCGCMVNKILVIRIDFLGDMVCTTPFIHSLRKRWPKSEIHVLANRYNSSIVINNPDVDFVYHYVYSKNHHKNDKPGLFYALINRIKLIFTLRREKFDLLVIPNGGMNKNSINFAKRIGVKDSRWHNELTEFDDRNEEHAKTRLISHEMYSGYKLVPEIHVDKIENIRLWIYPQLDLIAKWRLCFEKNNRLNIGFFISNNNISRRWSWDKWKELASKISTYCNVIIFHDPCEKINDVFLLEGVRFLKTNTVADLVAAMTYLDVVISADSAPVHISSALSIPVVALFESRPEKFLRWYPVGVERIILHEGETVNDIRVQSVCLAIKQITSKIKLD